jgi:hypothetical protein
MNHLQNQNNNQQKSNRLRQALNREVNIPEYLLRETGHVPQQLTL